MEKLKLRFGLTGWAKLLGGLSIAVLNRTLLYTSVSISSNEQQPAREFPEEE